MRCGAPCADDADRILGFLDEDHEQNASLVRLTDKNRSLGSTASSISAASGSANTDAASRNEIPCFFRFDAAFLRSHVSRTD